MHIVEVFYHPIPGAGKLIEAAYQLEQISGEMASDYSLITGLGEAVIYTKYFDSKLLDSPIRNVLHNRPHR